jgi:Raf kinase inhibitor-like YbhB/YbcL family protein
VRSAKLALVVVFLLLAGLAAYGWFRGASERRLDASYHAPLAKTLIVASTSFPPAGTLPARFTCNGGGDSPEVHWEGGGDTVKSYAITMTDFDIPMASFPLLSFTHWVVYNIPGDQGGIAQAVSDTDLRASGVRLARNSGDGLAYEPPCPPLGTHHYTFRVYALDIPAVRPIPDDAAGLLESMRGHVVAYGEMTGLAGR